MTNEPAVLLGLEDVRNLHEEEIERLLVSGLDDGRLADRAARYHLATGGKRLRAYLPVWLATNLGAGVQDALAFGAGLELLHNATLVHDDLQDGDTHRRGVPAVWTRWGAPQAINVGNALFFHGLSALMRSLLVAELLPAVDDAMLRVIGGQALEFQLQRPVGDPDRVDPSLASWCEMAGGKTGALFGACLRAGAVAARAPGALVEAAAGLGERLGLLFQVQDDLLDLVGDKGREQRATDIAEGKISYPVAWSIAFAAPAAVERLMAIVTAPRAETTSAMIAEAVSLLHDVGAVSATVEWLRTEERLATEDPVARLLPGLVDRLLAPVRHVM